MISLERFIPGYAIDPMLALKLGGRASIPVGTGPEPGYDGEERKRTLLEFLRELPPHFYIKACLYLYIIAETEGKQLHENEMQQK